MTELRALFYADVRSFVNDVRRAIRSPGRIVLWLVYAIAIAIFFVSRTFTTRHGTAGTGSDLTRADVLICAQTFVLATTLAFGAGRVGFFRTLAEARFVIGSVVRAPIAIAYLQARDSLASALRWISSLFYLGFVLAPHRLSAIGAVTDLFIVAAFLATANAIALTRKLARPPWPLVSLVVGIPLALAAVVPAVRDLAEILPLPQALRTPVLHALPAVHPGLILTAPNPAWLLAPLAIVALAVGMLASAGRDAYPELYALSVARIDGGGYLAQRRKRGDRASVRIDAVPVRVPAPAGSLVLVWKTLVEFRRTHANLALVVAGAFVWCAIGFATARLDAAFGPAFAGGLTSFFGVAILWLSFISTASLALELRRTLFWLSDRSLVERLAALVLAYNVRKIVTLGIVTIGVVVGGGDATAAFVTAVVLPALVLLMGSVGFVVYALLPSDAGKGGPIVLLRLGLSLVLLAPVAVVGLVGGLVDGVVAAAGIAVLALAECAALIALAAWRLDGRMDRIRA